MRYFILIMLLFSGCGKASNQTDTFSVCGVIYTPAPDQGGVIIDAQAAKPLPLAVYKFLPNNQVLLESGTYITPSNCLFSVSNNQAQFVKQD